MGMLRLPTVTTATATAIPTTTGYVTVTSTTGITRNAVVYFSWAGGGMAAKVTKVLDTTHFTALNLDSSVRNKGDLSAIPIAAVVYMPEQYVDDVDQTDAPISIAIPTRTT